MRKIALAVCVSILCMFDLIAIANENASAAPHKIQWKDNNNRLTAKPNQLLTSEFSFVNYLEHPIRISEVKTSCGCAVIDYPHEEIKSGEEGRLRALISTSGKNRSFKTSIMIIFQGDLPPEVINCYVKIEGSILIEPNLLVWNKDENDSPKKVVADLSNAQNARIVSTSLSDPNFIVKSELNSETRQWVFWISPKTNIPSAAIMEIETENNGQNKSYYVLLKKSKYEIHKN